MERVEITFDGKTLGGSGLAAYARSERLPTGVAAEELLGEALGRRRESGEEP